MKSLLILLLFISQLTNAQSIYSKDYGNKNNPAIIFIHGGPSGNSNLFEATTAQKLAEKGFYIIVYDRRGEGRSKDENATMTFNESFQDLLQIYTIYNLEKATILGHSFGGIIATLFTNTYPEKVNSLVLAGALFSQQETYNHILKQAKQKYKNDKPKLAELNQIKKLNKNSAEYRKHCYEVASELNFFNMPNPTTESKNLRQDYEKSAIYQTNYRNYQSPIKFYQNETQNNIDTKPVLKNILKKGINIIAIYGNNDGIFSKKQLSTLQKIIGKENMTILNNCSHYLFVDQKTNFLTFIGEKL